MWMRDSSINRADVIPVIAPCRPPDLYRTLAKESRALTPRPAAAIEASRQNAAGLGLVPLERKMKVTELLERVASQNEMIIRQNIEILLAVSVLVDEYASGKTTTNVDCEVASKLSSGEAA
jgi:hypothetical protein